MKDKGTILLLVILLLALMQAAFGFKGLLGQLGGFMGSESGLSVKMVASVFGSRQANESASAGLVVSPRSSALRGNESGVAVDGNIYSQGVGGGLNESGVALYLTPEDAFTSYKKSVTAYDEETTTTTTTTTSTTTTTITKAASQLTSGWNLVSIPLSL